MGGTIFLAVFGLLFLSIGIFAFIHYQREQRVINDPFTRTVEGKLIGHTESWIKSKNMRGRSTKTQVFHPVYEYYQGGVQKTYTSDSASSIRKKIGETCTLYIGQDGKIVTKGSSSVTLLFVIIFSIIGIGILCGSVLMWVNSNVISSKITDRGDSITESIAGSTL